MFIYLNINDNNGRRGILAKAYLPTGTTRSKVGSQVCNHHLGLCYVGVGGYSGLEEGAVVGWSGK